MSNFSKEQLEIFYHNQGIELKRAEHKLLLLTGCPTFGDSDGMNGCCVDCSEEDPRTWERCHIFQNALKEYMVKVNG